MPDAPPDPLHDVRRWPAQLDPDLGEKDNALRGLEKLTSERRTTKCRELHLQVTATNTTNTATTTSTGDRRGGAMADRAPSRRNGLEDHPGPAVGSGLGAYVPDGPGAGRSGPLVVEPRLGVAVGSRLTPSRMLCRVTTSATSRGVSIHHPESGPTPVPMRPTDAIPAVFRGRPRPFPAAHRPSSPPDPDCR